MDSSKTQRGIYFDEKVYNLINLLKENSDGMSGESIAQKIGVTRAYVSKMIKNLKNLGYKFEIRKKYKLLESPDIPLPWEVGKNVIFFESVDSTQLKCQELLKKGKIENGQWVLAITQSQGRGRLGRRWESPPGNFYGSVLLKIDIPLKEITKIPLLGGLSVFRTLKLYSLKYDIKLKWPNDVWVITDKPKKISGCIAELYGELDRTDFVILGVGVNVKNSPLQDISISLTDISEQSVSLIDFTQKLLKTFEYIWMEFNMGEGWGKIRAEIENNMWRGRVKVSKGHSEFVGTAVGIGKDGSLIVQREDASYEEVYYGDVFIWT